MEKKAKDWMTAIVVLGFFGLCAAESEGDYKIRPMPFKAVGLDETSFWAPRMEILRETTIWHCFDQCEKTGRINNFAKAGGLLDGFFEGLRFNDSDVYKVVEGASYVLAKHQDPKLNGYLDELIAKFAAAQQKDGYLYTTMTVQHDPDRPVKGVGKERWVHERESHELYCAGHLYEAAAAHYEATGKRDLLDVALKNADLLTREFGPNKRRVPPGHQEVEIGLVKLYRVTSDKKYLNLAKFFLDERGHAHDGRRLYGAYFQDHKPVRQQEEAVGHAVRAAYMYAAMADLAALTGDKELNQVVDRLWENVANKKLYVTGGFGGGSSEGFSAEYVMPNVRAYNETCSSVASVLWNYRMFLLHGDAKYIDILERTIYNSFLSGYGMSGDLFFYPNRLATVDGARRSPWFPCACCPSNVARFVPQIPGFIYAQDENDVYVNLYTAGTGNFKLGDTRVRLIQETNYPWDGKIRLKVVSDQEVRFTIRLRIPGWVRRASPTDLYRYQGKADETIHLKVNGNSAHPEIDKGYAVIRRTWASNDIIDLEMPMEIRRILTDEKVKSNRGLVAISRGPLIYCAEGTDNDGLVHNLVVPDDVAFEHEMRTGLLGGIMVVKGKVRSLSYTDPGGAVAAKPHNLVMIPYYAWAHRGPAPMRVWLARTPDVAWPLPIDTIAYKANISFSHSPRWSERSALNDQILPRDSSDQELPRFTWFNHRGTHEWVQYDFAKTQTISSAAVYWFDNSDHSNIAVPASWRVLYRDGDQWKPVAAQDAYEVRKDQFNTVTFDPVRTNSLRIDVQLQEGYSGGILEWRVRS